MTEFIVLTEAEAQKLRGVTKPGHALDPIPLEDGVRFILPLEVLSDPAHAVYLGERKADKVAPVDIAALEKRAEIATAEFKKVAEIAEVALDGKA